MRKTAVLVPAAVLAILGWFFMPVAGAATPHIEAHLSRTVVASGDPVTVTANANTLCDWIVDFAGERRHTVARSIRTTFTAPEVGERTRLNVVVTCVVHTLPTKATAVPAATNSGTHRDLQKLVVRIPAKAVVDPPLTVVPGSVVEPPHQGGHHPGGLPNTGGPELWLLLAGLLAIVTGAAMIRRSPAASRG